MKNGREKGEKLKKAAKASEGWLGAARHSGQLKGGRGGNRGNGCFLRGLGNDTGKGKGKGGPKRLNGKLHQ